MNEIDITLAYMKSGTDTTGRHEVERVQSST